MMAFNEGQLKRAKCNFLAGNRPCISSLNFTRIVLNGGGDTPFDEDTPVIVDERSQSVLLGKCEVRHIKAVA